LACNSNCRCRRAFQTKVGGHMSMRLLVVHPVLLLVVHPVLPWLPSHYRSTVHAINCVARALPAPLSGNDFSFEGETMSERHGTVPTAKQSGAVLKPSEVHLRIPTLTSWLLLRLVLTAATLGTTW
jgi:hypothetical protein